MGKVPATDRQKATARANLEKARQANAAKKAGPAAAPAPEPQFVDDAESSGPTFDPDKILRYSLNAPFNAAAVMLDEDRIRLSKAEEEIAASTIQLSLEMAGWTRFIRYAAPIAALCVVMALLGSRAKIVREHLAQREAEREIERATGAGETFVQQFEEHVEPAREARRQAKRSETGTRAVDPMDLTYLEEVG